jgi:hypothetical protein
LLWCGALSSPLRHSERAAFSALAGFFSQRHGILSGALAYFCRPLLNPSCAFLQRSAYPARLK